MTSLFNDTTFWVAIGFLILIAALGKKLVGIATAGLDSRAMRIRSQLEEAERLRREAEAMLVSATQKHAAASAEAKEILAKAEEETVRLRNHALSELDSLLKRREQLALEKIGEAERRAIREVELMAVDIAMTATRSLLTEKLAGPDGDRMIDDAIDDVARQLN
jgi:F-type H+-transporting ATPase subunit b